MAPTHPHMIPSSLLLLWHFIEFLPRCQVSPEDVFSKHHSSRLLWKIAFCNSRNLMHSQPVDLPDGVNVGPTRTKSLGLISSEHRCCDWERSHSNIGLRSWTKRLKAFSGIWYLAANRFSCLTSFSKCLDQSSHLWSQKDFLPSSLPLNRKVYMVRNS
jgi:hypothetical protein